MRNYGNIFDDCDAVIINSPHNLRYFCGFAGGEGYAVIGRDFGTLFVDSRYTVEAECECEGVDVCEYSAGHLLDDIKLYTVEHDVKKLGFEDGFLTYDVYKRFTDAFDVTELVPLCGKLDKIRMIKTEDEIKLLRQAEQIGCIALDKVLPLIKVGMTETDIAAEIEYQMKKLGAACTSFETIAVSGLKTAMPHGKPDEKKIEHGDFVTMDFGCVYKGYCSDMTRTIVMSDVSDKQREIYDIVLQAQLEGLSAIKGGVEACAVDKAARDVIAKAGYGKNFGHSLGHGVGLQIHEMPNLSPKSDIILEENMVVTCEPGIYIEGFGGVRIEDMVVVKDDGFENLTTYTKELLVCG